MVSVREETKENFYMILYFGGCALALIGGFWMYLYGNIIDQNNEADGLVTIIISLACVIIPVIMSYHLKPETIIVAS